MPLLITLAHALLSTVHCQHGKLLVGLLCGCFDPAGNLHIIGYNIDRQPYLSYGVISPNGSLLK